MKYAIGGVAFSGNKGAEGMLLSLIQNLSGHDREAEFLVMSYYPETDRKRALPSNIRVLDGSPKKVCLTFFPAIWSLFCRTLHLPQCLWNHGLLRQLSACAMFLDAAGISFCDGREKFTVFNVLTILPALTVGCPVIKVSQALGPFRHKLNHWMAQAILPHLHLIVARGTVTAQYLQELQLQNVACFSDCAFSLNCTDMDRAIAQALLKEANTVSIIGISPSQVVDKLCRKNDKDYLAELRKVIAGLQAKGITCVIFPHSARNGVIKTHNNDLPLVRKLADGIENRRQLIVIDRELEAGELRMLISEMDLLVASRFHAIVSSMAVGVPAAVIGWSHKYAEVLEPFEMEQYVQSYADFSAEKTLQIIDQLLTKRSSLSVRLLQETEKIRNDNRRFYDFLNHLSLK